MKKMRFLVLLVLLLTSLGLLAAEGIIGIWTSDYEWDGEPVTDYFEFYEDGTGYWYNIFDQAGSFDWELEGGELTITWSGSGNVEVYDFNFNKDGTFTIGYDYEQGAGYEEWTYEQIEY